LRTCPALALAGLLLLAIPGTLCAAVATVFLSDGAIRGELSANGNLWRVGKQEVRPGSVLCFAMDGNLPRLAVCGVRFTDGSYMSGKFPDYAAGRANTFESESFGAFVVQPKQVATIYVGGYPGRYPDQEAGKTQGVILRNGEFTAGEIDYVAVHYVGLRVDGRVRKYHRGQVYAALVGEVKAQRTTSWEISTLNGDRLPGEPSETGFRLLVRGERRQLALDRVALARQIARALTVEWRAEPAERWRPMRNGEEQVLRDLGQRALVRASWQQAPSAVTAKLPAGGKHLVLRAWREPGFFKGQMTIRVVSGKQTLKEIAFTPEKWMATEVIRFPTQTDVRVALMPGPDGGHGDRVVWEFLEFYR
jgi:hypothetical protein